jgi:hypothetical protein
MDAARVFVESTGRRIAPFDDPIGETPILNKPLAQWQADAFAEARLSLSASLAPPCLVIPDTLFASGSALRAFVDGAAGRDAVLVLKHSEFAKMTTPVQQGVREVEDGYLFEGIRFVSERREPARPVVVDPDERVMEFDQTTRFTGDAMKISLPKNPVMTLHHWIHVLWANQAAGGYEIAVAPRWKGAVAVLWAMTRARSANRWKILRGLSTRGKACDVHPTAVIEGSVLGDRVTVGPYARVLFSRVADGATISAGSQVEFSVLGENSAVSQNTLLRFSVLYPGATAGLGMQMSVLGREAVTTGASVLDFNLERPIRVELDGALHSSGQHFLGSAFGHRSRSGAGFFIAPGRTIPNDYSLVRNPERVLATLPPGLADAGPLVADERVLRPLRDN